MRSLSRLAEVGKAALDPRWVIIPTGGADKVSTFVSLLGSNKLNLAVLMDVSSKDKQRIENLQANALLGKTALIQVNEATETKNADIEDVFSANFYLELVNGAYKGKLPKKLTLSMLTDGNPRIVKKIEAYFQKEGVDGGHFNQYLPAEYMLREQVAMLPKLDSVTIERFTKLFERANALLPAS